MSMDRERAKMERAQQLKTDDPHARQRTELWQQRMGQGRLPRPSHGDYARFFRAALQSGSVSPDPLVAWADNIVARYAEAPMWAAELSLARHEEQSKVLSQLDQVPGAQGQLGERMFISLIGRLWEMKVIDWDAARGRLRSTAVVQIPEVDQRLERITIASWSADISAVAVTQIEENLERIFEPHRALEALIPAPVFRDVLGERA